MLLKRLVYVRQTQVYSEICLGKNSIIKFGLRYILANGIRIFNVFLWLIVFWWHSSSFHKMYHDLLTGINIVSLLQLWRWTDLTHKKYNSFSKYNPGTWCWTHAAECRIGKKTSFDQVKSKICQAGYLFLVKHRSYYVRLHKKPEMNPIRK